MATVRFGDERPFSVYIIEYVRPVVAGSTITTMVRLTEKIDDRKRIRFEVNLKNQRDEMVMIGELLDQTL